MAKFVPSIILGFEDYEWTISLKWANNFVQFGSEWVNFIKDAAVLVGDVLVLQETKYKGFFKVAIFDASIVSELEQSAGQSILFDAYNIFLKSCVWRENYIVFDVFNIVLVINCSFLITVVTGTNPSPRFYKGFTKASLKSGELVWFRLLTQLVWQMQLLCCHVIS